MRFVLVVVGLLAVLLPPCLSQFVPPFTDKNCRTDAYPPPAKNKVPSYVLNLDLAPEDRWTGLVKDKAPHIKFLVQDIIDIIGLFINKTIATEVVDALFAPLADTFPDPYKDELKGIATATGMPLGQVVIYNIFYEVSALCTSIVAQDENGDLYHARNLDFGIFLGWDAKTQNWTITERLRPLVTDVTYQKGGKTVGKAVHFAGYVGVLTGMKPGILTLTMNARHKSNETSLKGFMNWILGQRNAHWMGFALRDAIVQATDFKSSLNFLSTMDVMLPAYIIIGGNSSGEGAIITKAVGTKSDDIKMMKPSTGMWYLLETNYDNWLAPPFYDNRRAPGIRCMNNMTQANVGFNGIFNVLSTRPNKNALTVYTSLMHVKTGALETYLRYCPEPCYPW